MDFADIEGTHILLAQFASDLALKGRLIKATPGLPDMQVFDSMI